MIYIQQSCVNVNKDDSTEPVGTSDHHQQEAEG